MSSLAIHGLWLSGIRRNKVNDYSNNVKKPTATTPWPVENWQHEN